MHDSVVFLKFRKSEASLWDAAASYDLRHTICNSEIGYDLFWNKTHRKMDVKEP